jgi:uncharacterized protein YycO
MASNANLDQIPLIPYSDLWDTVQNGDILFYSGEDEISKLIRWATNSIWSHVGILFKVDSIQRIMILESVESQGVRVIPLSKYIQNHQEDLEAHEEKPKARLVIARHQNFQENQLNDLLNFGMNQITRPYDRDEIQRIMIRIATGQGKQERDKIYMCSELIFECFMAVDLEIPYNKLGFISPEDIWIDDNVVSIAEIEHLSESPLTTKEGIII